MARRRGFTLRAYTRRRWRAIGLGVVLLAATFLFFVVTDRGHDPLWIREDGDVAALSISASGDTVYSALSKDGVVTSVRAIDAAGDLRWFHEVNATSVLMGAGDGWLAIATPFPGAELTAWRESDGAILYRDFIPGNPRSLAVRDGHLAVALQAPGNPVLVFENLTLRETLRFRSFVISMALTPSGHLAAGTSAGEIVVRDRVDEVLNTSRPIHVQSLRLSDDGTKLLAGGFSIVEGDLSGAVEYFDLEDPVPGVPKWSYPTRLGVGYVAMSRDGAHAVAVEERPPQYRVHYFDTTVSRPAWTHSAAGIVARDISGASGGVALSPAGDRFAVAAIDGGGIALVDGGASRVEWSYDVDGVTAIVFADDNPARFASNARLRPDRSYEATMLLDADAEPLTKDFPRFVLVILALELLAAVVAIFVDHRLDARR